MLNRLCTLLLVIIFFTGQLLNAQVRIPAYSGYATPVETFTDDESQSFFSEKNGVQHWTDPAQQLHYFFTAAAPGLLQIQLQVKNAHTGNKLRLSLAGRSFVLRLPAAGKWQLTQAVSVLLPAAGSYELVLSSLTAPGSSIADLQAIVLSGKLAQRIQFNKKARRNAASVHLRYDLPDTMNAVSFYTELMVPPGADNLYSYYMANGFARGYFGMQVNSAAERRVIFSVWDAGNEPAERSKVSADNRVQLMAKGNDVVAEDFGNEGTGGHSHWVYPWKAGTTYRFLVTALPDSASNSSFYSGYFFVPELQQWKLIAAFKAPKDGRYLHGLYSFVENFEGATGQLQRKALFGNQWIKTENGQWHELTSARFTYDATGKAGDRSDYGAGVENNAFFLWNGGFLPAAAQYDQTFQRPAGSLPPVIDFYRNVDSASQAATDHAAILAFIAGGKMDTTASVNGLYYQVLSPGTGDLIQPTDTVLARYKGALLDGTVFDETKEKPASFPLNRLIKGWQLGLGTIRAGGSIRMIIPSALAYGTRMRSAQIPPNCVLLFDVQVLETKPAK